MPMRRLRSLLLLPILLTACAASPDMPPWFDGLQRQPIHTVTVNGTRIAYLDIGGGPPVILIHGFGGSMWQWEYQQASGLSGKPDIAYTPDEMVAFLSGFMDALGIQKAALVGNSMGAGLVISMAVAHPDRVDRIVLISGLPKGVREKLTGPLIKRAVETSAPVWLIRFGVRIRIANGLD
jgi:pimeloyl-ACP methyl ester carboxylesterase